MALVEAHSDREKSGEVEAYNLDSRGKEIQSLKERCAGAGAEKLPHLYDLRLIQGFQ